MNPSRIVNESEVIRILKHINEENEKAEEEFYKMNSEHKNYYMS
jgi:hypothetical protein